MTNSLKVDLGSHNQFIQALSLVAIGNLATQDMARDLASDVEKLLRSNNSYLRKKAALAAIRLLKKEPDLIEHMSERIVALLKDKAHGVLISALQLMIDVLDLVPTEHAEYVKLVPSLVRLLRNLISSGFSPEHDVGGITDPFIQVKLLHLLRLLGKGSEESSELMNDVLAQVATNTDTAKNAGNAILYECVQTIMEVESEASLRVLAINILGRFLLNRDNNIRYVALNSLSKVIGEDIAAVQRHRSTIVECLRDPDISIRQRALELVFQLINEQNVVALTSELLAYLSTAHVDQKGEVVSKMMTEIVEKYTPSQRWRVDTVISMLSSAGNECDDIVPRTAIIFIAQAKGLQGYVVHRLYRCLGENTSQLGLVQVAIWCLGEYSDLLVVPFQSNEKDTESFPAVAAESAVNLLVSCLRLHNVDVETKAFVLSALVKISTRIPTISSASIIKVIEPFKSSMNLELQQRGIEYCSILSSRWDRLRGEVLGKMPVQDEASFLKRKYGSAQEGMSAKQPALNGFKTSAATQEVSLLDLDDIFGGPSTTQAPSNVTTGGGNSHMDLLNDIFSAASLVPNSSPAFNSTAPYAPQTSSAPVNDPLDLMYSLPAAPLQPQQYPMPLSPQMELPQPEVLRLVAYESAVVKIVFEVSKPIPSSPASTRIIAQYTNKSGDILTNFIFQVLLFSERRLLLSFTVHLCVFRPPYQNLLS